MQNNNSRQKDAAQAMSWWTGLSANEKARLVARHFPEKEYIIICLSSMKIQKIYSLESATKTT